MRSRSKDRRDSRDKGRKRSRSKSREKSHQKFKEEPWKRESSSGSGSGTYKGGSSSSFRGGYSDRRESVPRGGISDRGSHYERGSSRGTSDRGRFSGPSERGRFSDRGGFADRGRFSDRGGANNHERLAADRGRFSERGGASDRGRFSERGSYNDRGRFSDRGGFSERNVDTGFAERGRFMGRGGQGERGRFSERGKYSDRENFHGRSSNLDLAQTPQGRGSQDVNSPAEHNFHHSGRGRGYNRGGMHGRGYIHGRGGANVHDDFSEPNLENLNATSSPAWIKNEQHISSQNQGFNKEENVGGNYSRPGQSSSLESQFGRQGGPRLPQANVRSMTDDFNEQTDDNQFYNNMNNFGGPMPPHQSGRLNNSDDKNESRPTSQGQATKFRDLDDEFASRMEMYDDTNEEYEGYNDAYGEQGQDHQNDYFKEETGYGLEYRNKFSESQESYRNNDVFGGHNERFGPTRTGSSQENPGFTNEAYSSHPGGYEPARNSYGPNTSLNNFERKEHTTNMIDSSNRFRQGNPDYTDRTPGSTSWNNDNLSVRNAGNAGMRSSTDMSGDQALKGSMSLPSTNVPRPSSIQGDGGFNRPFHSTPGSSRGFNQEPPVPPKLTNWEIQPPAQERRRDIGDINRFPITSDGQGSNVGMGYSVEYHSTESGYGKQVPDGRQPADRLQQQPSNFQPGAGIEARPFQPDEDRSSRLNMEMNSIPGMNPPAPDPTPASGSGGGGPDYAALLQYLQYYQKQMGTEESRK